MAPRPSSALDNGSDRDGIEAEKGSSQFHEHVHDGALTPEDANFLANFTDAQRKTVLRKVDWRLVPMLLVLYLISFIDRANIGMSRSMVLCPTQLLTHTGMSRKRKDRRPSPQPEHVWNAVQHCPRHILYSIYSGRWVQTIRKRPVRFGSLLATEVPSNALLNKFERPSTFMGIIVTIWGVVMMCTGFVKNFAGLCVARIFLGLFEYVSPYCDSACVQNVPRQAWANYPYSTGLGSSQVRSSSSRNGTYPERAKRELPYSLLPLLWPEHSRACWPTAS